MRGFVLALLLLGSVLWGAGVVDRIAVVVGDSAITESELILDALLVEFVNGSRPDISREAKCKAAERLIDQELIRREIKLSEYPAPEPRRAGEMLADFKKQRFRTEAAFQRALEQYGLTEDELKTFFLWQRQVLDFTDHRFRPGVFVSRAQAHTYYLEHGGAVSGKSFEELRQQIERKLISEQVDARLDAWLKAARGQISIEWHEEAFE
jgi:hypothetical protein